MGWKILAVILALIWIESVFDGSLLDNDPMHWIGRGFSLVGLLGLLAYAFGWALLDQRFWLPFAYAFAAWLTFTVLRTAVLPAWSLASNDGDKIPGAVLAVTIPVAISFFSWLPVWRYANGKTVA